MPMRALNLTVAMALTVFFGEAVIGCQMESVPDSAGPESLIEAWVAMWNSYDLDQVEVLFLDDDRLSYFSSEKEGLIKGMAAVLEHHVGFGFVAGGKDQSNRLWLEDLNTDLFQDAAVVTGIWFFASGPEEGGADPAMPEGVVPTPQKGPVTFVCVYQGWPVAVHPHVLFRVPPSRSGLRECPCSFFGLVPLQAFQPFEPFDFL